jgi:hypothetical protein
VQDAHVVGADHRDPVPPDRGRPLLAFALGRAEAGVVDDPVAHQQPRPGGVVGEFLMGFRVGAGAIEAGVEDERADAVPGQLVIPGRADAGVAEEEPERPAGGGVVGDPGVRVVGVADVDARLAAVAPLGVVDEAEPVRLERRDAVLVVVPAAGARDQHPVHPQAEDAVGVADGGEVPDLDRAVRSRPAQAGAGAGVLLARSRRVRRGLDDRAPLPHALDADRLVAEVHRVDVHAPPQPRRVPGLRPLGGVADGPVPRLTQMVSPEWRPWWPSWPLPAHDAGALPSIVSAASPAMHSRALSFMLLPPLLAFVLAK